MQKFTLLLFLLLPACCFFQNSVTFAQEKTSYLDNSGAVTKIVTDLIFSVDPKNNGVNEVFLKGPDLEAQLYLLKGDCYRCEFYEGNIEGPFTVNDFRINPGRKATLTINTLDNLMDEKIFDPGKFPPGSKFNLGRTKTTVIENQKGSFKLRTN